MARGRKKMDAYYTAEWEVEVLLRALTERGLISPGDSCFEPCVGEGVIPKIFSGQSWTTNDLDPEIKADFHFDARKMTEEFSRADGWIITNPPYKHTSEVLEQCLKLAPRVAMFLRASYIEPCQNRAHLPDPDLVLPVPRRSYTGDGKVDCIGRAWMVWGVPEHRGIFKVNRPDWT